MCAPYWIAFDGNGLNRSPVIHHAAIRHGSSPPPADSESVKTKNANERTRKSMKAMRRAIKKSRKTSIVFSCRHQNPFFGAEINPLKKFASVHFVYSRMRKGILLSLCHGPLAFLHRIVWNEPSIALSYRIPRLQAPSRPNTLHALHLPVITRIHRHFGSADVSRNAWKSRSVT